MATQNLAVFKYQHRDSLVTPMAGLGRTLVFLAPAIISLFFFPPLAIFLLFAGIVVLAATWPKRKLSLGPRYLLCGNSVVYYANVRRMTLRENGALILEPEGGPVFTLEWDRFPTNARKDQKILNNKNAKFKKASSRIIQRVLQAAPHVECVGINRAEWQA